MEIQGNPEKIGLQRTFNIQLNVVVKAFLKCFNGWLFWFHSENVILSIMGLDHQLTVFDA